jgi:hypothetical protein
MKLVVIQFFLTMAFALKHFVADYPLQTPSMLKKFSPDWREWTNALMKHVGVHGFFTFLIAWWATTILSLGHSNLQNVCFAIALADFNAIVHFVMDRLKASPNLLGKYKALSAKEFATATPTQIKHNTWFWWSLGLDQMVHHLTDLICAFAIILWL